jgi:hypothetical protein
MSVSEPPKLLSPDERRKLYFDEYQDRVDRHRSGSAFYEQRAIEFATNGFKILAYLNGGGLIAIPAAVALFRTDARDVKSLLVCAAAAFIAGLILGTIGQFFAFFVTARRSEAEIQFQFEQMELLAAAHYPGTQEEQSGRAARAQQNRDLAHKKLRRSDIWRIASLVCVWLSLLLFIGGALLGGACTQTRTRGVRAHRRQSHSSTFAI